MRAPAAWCRAAPRSHQQLAKNLFLNNERTIERKVKEAFLAVWLETRLTKNEILKLYLDRAYMGGGAFGVDAAAQYYFNKSARDVNLAEAAMLAGLFKAPTRFAPHVNLPAARSRANIVLDNLVEAGFMSEGQVFGARRTPASAVDRRDERSPNYYLDWAYDEMRKLVETFPKSMTERVFIVRTALDVNLQREAENAVENALRQHGKEYGASQAGAVVMEVDGAVRAMVGGRDYGVSQFNRTTDALRQPGSSFKPYVYAAALMSGKFNPNSKVVDSPVCIGNWCPHNYSNGYSGSMSLTSALTRSINTIAVKLSIAIGDNNSPKSGRQKIVRLAKAMGLRTPLPDSTSLPIGAAEVTVLDHVGAYATFPNLGKAVTPHAVLEVRNGSGEVIWRFDRDGPKPRQVMPEQVARDMNFMMNKVVEEGTGKRALLDGIKVAGKTGTTNAFRDAWFVAYTGNYVGGIWMGNDDYQLHQENDRRHPAGADLGPDHGLCASGHRTQAADRGCAHAAAAALAGHGRRRARLGHGAPDAADQECGRHPGADRAPDGRRPQRPAVDQRFHDRRPGRPGRANHRLVCRSPERARRRRARQLTRPSASSILVPHLDLNGAVFPRNPVCFRCRRRRRPRRHLAVADARLSLRRGLHRRLDRLAAHRNGRHRSLCACDDRAHRRIAGRRR